MCKKRFIKYFKINLILNKNKIVFVTLKLCRILHSFIHQILHSFLRRFLPKFLLEILTYFLRRILRKKICKNLCKNLCKFFLEGTDNIFLIEIITKSRREY